MSDAIVDQDMKHRHQQAMLRMWLRAAVLTVAMLVALGWARCSLPTHKTDAYKLGRAHGYERGLKACKE